MLGYNPHNSEGVFSVEGKEMHHISMQANHLHVHVKACSCPPEINHNNHMQLHCFIKMC